MTSLLDLLNQEHGLVSNINRYELRVALFEKRIEDIQEIDIDCEAKQNDLTSYSNAIDEARAFIILDKMKLDEVRDQLRSYIKTLIEEGLA